MPGAKYKPLIADIHIDKVMIARIITGIHFKTFMSFLKFSFNFLTMFVRSQNKEEIENITQIFQLILQL